MYLSRLILNPRSRQVQREFANPYQMHRTILKAFPTGKVDVARDQAEAVGVLYRVDVQPQSGQLTLLVQSQLPPDWSTLLKEATSPYLLPIDPWQADDNPAVKQSTFEFRPDQLLRFRLRANPTKRLGKSAEFNKGKRVGIYSEEAQTEWLKRKAEMSGFRLRQVQASRDERYAIERTIPHKPAEASSVERFTVRQSPDTMHNLTLQSVQFDGILQVTDPVAFLTAIQSGIGSGKAFGFGLLSVAPVRGSGSA